MSVIEVRKHGPRGELRWARSTEFLAFSPCLSDPKAAIPGGRWLSIAQSHLCSSCILLRNGLALESACLDLNSDSIPTCWVVVLSYSTSLCLCFPMYSMGIM